MAKTVNQPWIGSPFVDSVFILSPPFLALSAIALFPQLFGGAAVLGDAGWVILVLVVDVAHVYSTLYRTYCDPEARRRHGRLLWMIPALCYGATVMVYSLSSALFWSILAYVAVYHFVRQQYGFMRIYSRRDDDPKWMRRLDSVTVYGATVYPLLWWHLRGQREFNWFVEGDFFYFPAAGLLPVLNGIYLTLMGAYLVAEGIRWARRRRPNLPRLLLVAGTALSWYFGIVYFNGDMAFTLTNVLSHGIPYIALVWIYGQKRYVKAGRGTSFLRLIFSRRGLLLFIGILVLLAFIEEGLWDIALWREHRAVFGTAGWKLGQVPPELLALVVPLLALPQLTHYVLDGFIWKIGNDDFRWSRDAQPAAPAVVATARPLEVEA